MDEQMPPLPDQVAHIHSDGDFCWDRQPDPVWWPVNLFTAEQMHAYAKEYAAALSQPAAAQGDSDHSAGGECGGVQVVWPKENRVGRREDMSPDGTLIVGLDSDNDVYVEVSAERHGQWQSAAVEFCNGGGGGGQSSRTRAALISLMTAMEADNAAHPYKAFPGAPKATP